MVGASDVGVVGPAEPFGVMLATHGPAWPSSRLHPAM
jgi:hypothetical protein